MEFKQPKLYSSSELRKVFDNIDSIKFLAISNFNTVPPDVGRLLTMLLGIVLMKKVYEVYRTGKLTLMACSLKHYTCA